LVFDCQLFALPDCFVSLVRKTFPCDEIAAHGFVVVAVGFERLQDVCFHLVLGRLRALLALVLVPSAGVVADQDVLPLAHNPLALRYTPLVFRPEVLVLVVIAFQSLGCLARQTHVTRCQPQQPMVHRVFLWVLCLI